MLFLRGAMASAKFYLAIFAMTLLPVLASAQTASPETSDLAGTDSPTNQTGEVNLIVEGTTYTPTFYRGRAEPSPGNPIRLVAIPFIEGAPTEAEYEFLWNVNNEISRSIIPGKYGVLSTLAPYTDNMFVEVRVLNESGVQVAKHSEYISFSEPEIILYEENPLRGRSAVAIGSDYTLVGSETTVRAEPYFFWKRWCREQLKHSLEPGRSSRSTNRKRLANNCFN